MPFVRRLVLDVEDIPDVIAFDLIIAPDRPHVTQFVPQRHDLRIVTCLRQPVNRRLLACMPGLFLVLTIEQFPIDLVTLRMHQFRDPVTERFPDLLYRHVRIFDRVVQRCSC